MPDALVVHSPEFIGQIWLKEKYIFSSRLALSGYYFNLLENFIRELLLAPHSKRIWEEARDVMKETKLAISGQAPCHEQARSPLYRAE